MTCYIFRDHLSTLQLACRPGEAYLTCLTEVANNCPGHGELLPFDLHEAIDATRQILQRECESSLVLSVYNWSLPWCWN